MDLLGSILDSMDKPPSVSQKERERIKSNELETTNMCSGFMKYQTLFLKFYFRNEGGDVEATIERKGKTYSF